METLRGNRKATTHLPVYRYGYISRLSGMNPQFMVSDHLSGIPTFRPLILNTSAFSESYRLIRPSTSDADLATLRVFR
jgi:hypothetical protein